MGERGEGQEGEREREEGRGEEERERKSTPLCTSSILPHMVVTEDPRAV